MNIFELISITVKSLMAAKMRSFLTMLGIIIGVFAVISLVSMGEGLKGFMYDQVASLGTGPNYMELHPGAKHGMGGASGAEITFSDVAALRDRLDTVSVIDPRVLRPADAFFGDKKFSIPMVMGTSQQMVESFNWNVAEGRFFSEADVSMRKKVCVLGKKVATALFGALSPIGEKIKIDTDSFLVMGVFEEKGALFTFDYDEMAVIPITAAADVFHLSKVMEVGITVKNEQLVPQTVEEIKKILIRRHGKEDFRIDTQAESMDMLNSIMNVLTGVVSGIAAISLIVGGIGIMNIMLVSVTERTREIGLRKALGARKKDIVLQFLAEAVVISLAGGIIGILSGIGCSFLFLSMVGFPLKISLKAILLAAAVSMGVGVVSGVYPAMRAGQLDPIEALRYE
ncbi:MAG: ABC transporter permease [Candidatus Margulisiibacteriota bacterium]